jgi:tRNA pseudouridine38/39 synthase
LLRHARCLFTPKLHRLQSPLADTSARRSIPVASTPTPHKHRKPSRAFDASRHSSRLIALKFAYLGQAYNGYEYHGNATPLPTVEEVLFKALLKARLVPGLPDKDPESIHAWPSEEVTEYSKCGRTDRGVSAFGQVVGVRVRSNKPLPNPQKMEVDRQEKKQWDDVKDEMPYPHILNRLLPPTIRVLAWAPHPPEGFSARFNCCARHYRYFFTNPVLSPATIPPLDIEAMRKAAKYFLGSHDFRNFCKLDASKQIENFARIVLHASIEEVEWSGGGTWYFDLKGTAFLWHQVRHMMAALFLVGQGLEPPETVRDMLDLDVYPTKPAYEMADDRPLVLWNCIFEEEELKWVYAQDGKRDARDALVDSVWAEWHKSRIDEMLVEGLLRIAKAQQENPEELGIRKREVKGHVLVLGNGEVTLRGKYVEMAKRERMRPVEEINRSWVERKGDWREKRGRKRVKVEEGDAKEVE